MREIKYRMWNKKENKMYQVGVLDFDYNQVYMTGYLNHTTSSYLYEDIELMQFTGLHDKNGKEIYEGDIIEFSYDVFTGNFDTLVEQGEVVFTDGAFYIEVLKKDEWFLLYTVNIDELEVIGNIYENPKLLKGSDNI